jgi:UDP-N-acetylmuramoylalanine--D-glutamate ligase
MSIVLKKANLPNFKKIAVIGFGMTGQSVMRFFAESTAELIAMDTREFPPNKKELQGLFPRARLVTGGLDQHTLETADVVVLSPGIGADDLELEKKIGEHTRVVGDIQLFRNFACAPIIAITGSNGKSTVATLVDLMINATDKTALLGGNIGVPALDLFQQADPDFYVLELSSFQLDTVQSLDAQVAVVLNVSEDHLDRYASFAAYVTSKSSIYRGAKKELVNRDDTSAPTIHNDNTLSFGLDKPLTENDYGLLSNDKGHWIVKGEQQLLNVSDLKLRGKQNWANVMAALALVELAGLKVTQAVIDAACDFAGLPHRCEAIATINSVSWVNDSKGTNVGATLAAISGFSEQKVLILGGLGKGADFRELRPAMDETVRAVILLGEDAALIEKAIGDLLKCIHVENLEKAVSKAQNIAQAGDVVLFSPACASMDMFANFMARGECFKMAVSALAEGQY